MQQIIQHKRFFVSYIIRAFCVLAVSMCCARIGGAAIDPNTSGQNIEMTLPKLTEKRPESGVTQISMLSASQNSPVLPKERKKTGGTDALPVTPAQVRQILLMGAVLVIIGTFFIPHMLPQIGGYHEKLSQFLERTVKREKMIPPVPPQRGSSQAAQIGALSMSRQQTVLRPGRVAPRTAYPAPRAADLTASVHRAPYRKLSSNSAIETFFQQSGFTISIRSDFELSVSSQLARYRSYGEIPVYVMNNTVLNKQHVQQIYTKMKAHPQHTHEKGQGRMAFVIVTTPPDETAYRQIYNYRLTQNYTIIPLSHLLIAKSVRHASCAQQLEEKINAFTGQCNLYAMNTPVADPLSFFGRKELIRQLLTAIEHQKTLGIFGVPKIGKTWLLWQLKEHLSQYLTVYIDVHQLPKSCSYLYRKIIDESVRDLGFKYPDLKLPRLHLSWTGSSENDEQEFVHDLLTVWKCAKMKRQEPKIIVLLDGVEHLLPTSAAEDKQGLTGFQEFLGTLQKLAQQHGFLTTILSFSSLTTIKGNVFQKVQLDKRFSLPSLNEDGCNQMITIIGAQMGLQYPEETLSRLYYETGGHPYVTRQLCSLIAKNLRRSRMIALEQEIEEQITVQVRDVEQAVAEYLEYKNEYLETLWQQLSPVKQNILRAIALEESCTLAQLIPAKLSPQVREARQQALIRLEEHDLIDRCEEKYSMKMGLLQQNIVRKNKGEDV